MHRLTWAFAGRLCVKYELAELFAFNIHDHNISLTYDYTIFSGISIQHCIYMI